MPAIMHVKMSAISKANMPLNMLSILKAIKPVKMPIYISAYFMLVSFARDIEILLLFLISGKKNNPEKPFVINGLALDPLRGSPRNLLILLQKNKT